MSGGARYTDEEKTNTFDHGPALNRSDVPLVFGDSRTDWKVSVDFQLNDTMFLYAQSATGFTLRSGDAAHFHCGAAHGAPGRRAREQRDRREARVPRQSPPPERRGVYERLRPPCSADGRREPVRCAGRADPVPYRLGGGNCPAEHVVRRAERPCTVGGFAMVLLRQLTRDARRLRGRADGDSRRKSADQLLLRPQRVRKHQQRSGADELHLRRPRLSESNPSTPRAWASNTRCNSATAER